MDAGGNSSVQTDNDVIKSQSSALAVSRHSRPHLLLFDSNLFSSPSLVSFILFTESYIHMHSQLLHIWTLEIVGDQIEFLLHLLTARSNSNTRPYLPAHSGWLKTGRLNPVESIADKDTNWQSLSSSPPITFLVFVPLPLAQLCREWQPLNWSRD